MKKNYASSWKPCISITLSLLICLVGRGQIIITNFAGVSFNDTTALGTGGTPPDTMGAAGTKAFAEFINGAFAVYNKAGVRQSLISDANFWVNAGISSRLLTGLSDTRIQYDAESGRWFATQLTLPSTKNRLLLARSDTSDPSGTWRAVSFSASTNQFGDFDMLAVDALGVYVGVNDFTSSTGTFAGVSFFSIPKVDVLASTPTLANMTRFDNLSPNTYGFAMQGVNNPDAGAGHGVIMAVNNGAFNQVDRTTVNGPGAAGATLSSTTIIPTTFDGPPHPVTQPSGIQVAAGDHRFSAAVRQIGGYIFMANCILNGSRDAVHWMVVNETNNTLTSEGVISDPNFDFTYPSIAASHAGKVLLGFSRVGASAPAGDLSTYAALGTVVNGVVTMGAPFLLRPGAVSNFSISFDSQPYRWGDYSATMFDPTDENLVWTIQEIPISSSAWGTEISLISLATNQPSLTFGLSSNTLTLSWPLSADPGYVLQSNPDLSSGAWTTVAATPAVIVNQRVVTLAATGPALFFRLEK